MSAPSKFNLSSDNPDRPLCTTGQRSSFLASSLERSSSFRKTTENPGPSAALPIISRNNGFSSLRQEEVMNFLQYLRFDSKLVAADLKFHQQGDFKRLLNVCLAISPDDSGPASLKSKMVTSPSPEELKRVMASLRGSSIKARERGRLYHDALSAFNKYFPSLPSRKRSRSDIMSSRISVLQSGDQSVLGPGAGKMGMQTDTASALLENEQPKSEERTRSDFPNKRTRTSLVDMKMDARVNVLDRPSGPMAREILRVGNNGVVQSEDRMLSIGVDWEKSKMKKKRSGIKPDLSPITTSMSNKPIDGYREPKQGMQQRPVNDARLGLTNAAHEFRQPTGLGKSEGTSQQPSLGMRSSMPRSGQDNNSLLRDRRDRPSNSDKERVNLRAVNKTHSRDDSSSASPTPSIKLNAAAARAPRSSSSVVRKSSPVLLRPATPDDLYDISHSSIKHPISIVGNNRKRSTPSARSPSPPVGQWVGQKQQHISRPVRRTTFVPIVPGNASSPASDNTENGSGSMKRVSGTNSPRQAKVKNDNFSLTGLSESEDSASAVAETIFREKNKKCDEILDEKSGQNVQKMSSLLPSMRKNKLVSGDGVRRQGRTGRGFSAARSPVPMGVDKRGGVGTAKQLRSAKLGVDNKTESRVGRPPTRKLSDRKAYNRQKNIVVNTETDFLVGPDDGHGELLAAVKALINTTNAAHACSSSFWKKMECYFTSISDVHIAYLRQQVYDESAEPTPLNVDCSGTIPNGNWLIKCERDNTCLTSEARNEKTETKGNTEITLFQRLLSAIIVDVVDSEEVYGNGLELDLEFEENGSYYQSGKFQIDEHADFDGYGISSTGKTVGKIGHNKVESNIDALINSRSISMFSHSSNGNIADLENVTSLACSEVQYEIMSLDNRILLEIQSVGLFPEPVPYMPSPEDEEIIEKIQRLEEMHQQQAPKTKSLVGNLLKVVMEKRQLQEKELEQSAIEKLIEMTYGTYMTFCGPSASGGKSSSTKVAKKSALDSVRRTIEQCQRFEDTGKSCFSETTYKDMLLSGIFRVKETHLAEDRDPVLMDQSPLLASRFNQNIDSQDIYTDDTLPAINYSDTWSNRVKKRELLLDDVGLTQNTLNAPSGIQTSLPSSTKGKRSERDRDGKGNTKTGRPSLSNTVKGERKSKAKPKQKTTQLSSSSNGRLGKISEQPVNTRLVGTSKDAFESDVLDEAIDLSHLQLPGMDVLGGVHGDVDDQGQDLDSWLNIDDDVLQQDHDFMGLEIPMDDLSDLNLMV